ncbi:MAG: hypothetical protein ACFCVE_12360 [Phycisphaerae bacterium]
MIPAFTTEGLLPPGVHPATMNEFEERFGRGSEVRRDQMQSLRWLLAELDGLDVSRIVINGSFVTNVFEPNDVDVAVEVPIDLVLRLDADAAIRDLPIVHLHALVPSAFKVFVESVYGKDRVGRAKGMIEVTT